MPIYIMYDEVEKKAYITVNNGNDDGFEIDGELIASILHTYMYHKEVIPITPEEVEPILFVEGVDEDTNKPLDFHLSFSGNMVRIIFISTEILSGTCNADNFIFEMCKLLVDHQDYLDMEDVEEEDIEFAQNFLKEHSGDFSSTIEDDCSFKCPEGPGEKCTQCHNFQTILKRIYDFQEETQNGI